VKTEGYKQTDIGTQQKADASLAQIPAEWDMSSLADVMTIQSKSTQPSPNGKSKYVGLEHIDSGNPKLKRWGTEGEVRSSKNKFNAGDVLYGKLRPYLDKVVLAEWEGMCATDILVFRAKQEKAVPEYLVNLLHTSEVLNHAISTTTGVNHPRTSWHALQRFLFELPPLPEQRTIAAILSKVQQAIETQEKIIERTKELKKSLMAKLFTEGLHGEELKETEIGLMPKSWEVCKVEQKYVFTKKPSALKIETFKEIPFVPMELVPAEGVFFGNYYLRKPSEISSGTYFEPNDILLAKITPSFENGKQGIITELPTPFGYATTEVIPIKGIEGMSDYLFLFYYLLKEEVRSSMAGKMEGSTGRQRLPKTIVQSLQIPFPLFAEQKEISSILLKLDYKIRNSQNKIDQLKNLFKSMLHQLMTGTIRVNNVEVV